MVKTQSLALSEVDQRLTLAGLQWHQFKAIQASFESVSGVRLAYYEGVLEIVGIGKSHEAIRCLIGLLLGQFFLDKGIEFFPSGSYSQIVEGVTEYQADLSYCFDTDKDIPDLSVEVVMTSGSPIKLRKYLQRGVLEVWFWEDGILEIYCLQEQGYEKRARSELLPELDLILLARCILISSPLEAIKEFRQGISN